MAVLAITLKKKKYHGLLRYQTENSQATVKLAEGYLAFLR